MNQIARYYIEPKFFFTYEWFPMVSPWPEPWIYLHFLAMGLFAAGIMLGLFYRLAAVLFCLVSIRISKGPARLKLKPLSASST